MQKLLPNTNFDSLSEKPTKKEEVKEELELFSNNLNHFSYEEFKKFPKRLKFK